MATKTLNRRKDTTEPLFRDGEDQWKPAGHYDPGFKEFIESELDRLAALPRDWDHYGAPAIDPEIIAAAKSFVHALPENIAYRPRIVPMSPGNLQFEWHQGTKVLELEFENPRTIHFLQFDPNAGIEEEESFRVSETDRAVDLIQWFMLGTNCL
jgi:hypothetical protein